MTRIVCSQHFLLENLTVVLSLFLLSQWQASILSPEIFTQTLRRILQTLESSWSCSTAEGMPTTFTHSRQESCPFSQHCRSTELSCLTKASFIFLTAMTSDSRFLKLRCIFSISSVRMFIVLLICSWVFKESLMSFVLFKSYNDSSV